MKILVITLSGIGDSLLFTPALKILKQEKPGWLVDVLVMFPGAADIFRNNSDVNEVITFNFMREGFLKSLRFLLKLRGRYDITINAYPSNRKEYNILSYIIGAKKRAAVKYLRMNFSNFGFLNNITADEDDSVHCVQTNIRMVEKILNKKITEEPPLQFPLDETNYAFAENYFSEHGFTGRRVIGFHAGCSTLKNHIKRRWEPEKFAELGKKLLTGNNTSVLLFGGKEEEELKLRIKNFINSEHVFIISTNNLADTAALIKNCSVFVTNDSSLMHVASAMQTSTVAIIGPTNVDYIHPWKTRYKIATLNLDCSPCFFYSPKPLNCKRDDIKYKCIRELDVEIVLNSVYYLLKANEK